MSRICVVIGLLVLSFSTPAAPALPGTPLEWKLKDGQTFYIDETTAVKMDLAVMGNAVSQEQTTQTVWRIKVLKIAENGDIQLEQRYESIKATIGGAPNAENGANPFKALEGLTFKATLNNKLEVIKFEGYAEFAKKAEDPNGRQLKAFMPEETFKSRLAEPFQLLPNRTVENGGKWKQTSLNTLFPWGMLKVERDFTYDGPIRVNGEEMEKLTFTAKMTHKPSDLKEADLPLKIEKFELTGGEAKGTVLFTPRAQRIASVEQAVKDMKFAMSIDAGGNKLDVEGTINQTTTWKLLDELPKK